ncbi:MAG: hypothetical protein AAF449_22540, partial [Myxococcota bacterium]
LALIEGEGINSQLFADTPASIRAQLQDGSLTESDLARVGLSSADNGLLSASLKNELSAASQHYNATALEQSPTRLAIVDGQGMDQQAVLVSPSEVQDRLASGVMTEGDLTRLGLSTADNGILNAATRKERLEQIEADPSEEAQELQRLIDNPDSDSGALVREAVQEGHADRLKRYVAGNGTDGIGSFARTLLDGNLSGAGGPPTNGSSVTGGLDDPDDVDVVSGPVEAPALSETNTLSNSPGFPSNASEVLDEFKPGSGFSTVYNRATGEFIALPSEGAQRVDGGDVDVVPRRGGHRYTEAALREQMGDSMDASQNVGLAIVLRDDGDLNVGWTSGQINTRNYGVSDRQAPSEFHEEILEALHQATGRNLHTPDGLVYP